ncbi:MAG: DMT family transporter [Azospirillaceae bacterium]
MTVPLPSPPARRARLLALTGGILACFTASWVLAKHIVDGAPPEVSAAGRVLATSVLLWAVFLVRPGARAKPSAVLRRWPAVVLLALLGFFLYSLLTFLALTVLDPSELGMTLALIPGFTYLLALAFFGDRLHPLKLVGVPLATGAALYYTTDGFAGIAAGDAFGIAAAAGAALSYALYGLFYKRLMGDLPITGVLPFVTATAFLMFLPWLAVLEPAARAIDPATALQLLLLGAGLSAPVFLMYHAVIVSGGVLYANSIGILSPFAILLAEWAVGYRDGVAAGELAAMAACAAGVALIFSHATRPGRAAAAPVSDLASGPPVGPIGR